VVLPVPHRQLVLTIPRMLRRPFQRDPLLLRELARCAASAILELVEAVASRHRVAMVVVIQTWGSLLTSFNPHLHVVMADGMFDPLGRFRALPSGWARALEGLLRERVFSLLIERRKLRPETAARMRSWRRSGFSAHLGRPIAPTDREALGRLLRYVARPAVVESRLTYRGPGSTAIYTAPRFHKGEKANFVALDPTDWLAGASQHIPAPKRHRASF
jgi:hypothetical protein